MIKLRIKQSKYFKQELNTLEKIKRDNNIYNLLEKPLHFKGAQHVLGKIVKLSKPINITYTESQSSVYEPEEEGFCSEYWWTANGTITLEFEYKPNSKTIRNIKYVSNILNKVWGYDIEVKYIIVIKSVWPTDDDYGNYHKKYNKYKNDNRKLFISDLKK